MAYSVLTIQSVPPVQFVLASSGALHKLQCCLRVRAPLLPIFLNGLSAASLPSPFASLSRPKAPCTAFNTEQPRTSSFDPSTHIQLQFIWMITLRLIWCPNGSLEVDLNCRNPEVGRVTIIFELLAHSGRGVMNCFLQKRALIIEE